MPDNEVPTTETVEPTRPWRKTLLYIGGSAIALLTVGALVSRKRKDSDETEWIDDIKEAVTEVS